MSACSDAELAWRLARIAAALLVRLGGRVELTAEEIAAAPILRAEPARGRVALLLLAEPVKPSE